MPAISEYAKVTTSQHTALRIPDNLEEVVRWFGWLLAAYLALRLIGAMLRGSGRR